MLYDDQDLNSLVWQKVTDGCHPEIKKKSHFFPLKNNVLEVYKRAFQLGHLKEDLDITVVPSQHGTYIFEMKPELVKPLVLNTQKPVKQSVPKKVLQKMIALRFNKTIEALKEINQNELSSYNFRRHSIGMTDVEVPVPHVFPELRTIQQARDWYSVGRISTTKVGSDFLDNVLSKPELTDQDISEAMDLVVVGDIMKE